MDSGAGKAIPMTGEDDLLAESALHASVPEGLFSLPELDVLYDDKAASLWTFMNPEGRPSFTPRSFAAFGPALVRSHISSRSNSARAPKT